jgi:hypothetical protein
MEFDRHLELSASGLLGSKRAICCCFILACLMQNVRRHLEEMPLHQRMIFKLSQQDKEHAAGSRVNATW